VIDGFYALETAICLGDSSADRLRVSIPLKLADRPVPPRYLVRPFWSSRRSPSSGFPPASRSESGPTLPGNWVPTFETGKVGELHFFEVL
jgi:hypothetical protein